MTNKNTQSERPQFLGETLGELAREQGSRTVLLHGLTEQEVAHFIEHATRSYPSNALVAAVYQRTEENPFFITEIVRLLTTEGADSTIHTLQSRSTFNVQREKPLESRVQDGESENPGFPNNSARPSDTRRQRLDARPSPTDSEIPASLFRQEADYWTIAFQGTVFRLRHIRGLGYLAHLLQHPNREFHVFDLVTAADVDAATIPSSRRAVLTEPSTSVSELGDAGEMLDPQARSAYKRRLADLREELQEASAFHDLGRIERIQHEIAFLTHELAAAVGLNGCSRRAAAPAERARVNVAKGIKAAVSKIAKHSPTLERYLTTTIKTGLFCSFSPDPRFPVHWQF